MEFDGGIIMKIGQGNFTVGDVGVSLSVRTNEDLTAKTIYFIFIKPSGVTLTKQATSISTYIAIYTWASGDLDEDGEWKVSLKNANSPSAEYEYQPGAISFNVRPTTEEMACG
jgi:hypothetical protein